MQLQQASTNKQAPTYAPLPCSYLNTICMLQQEHNLPNWGRRNTCVQCAVRTRAPCPRLQALDERRRARRRPHPGLRGSRLLQQVEQGRRRGCCGRMRVRACGQGRGRRGRGGHQRAHHAGSGAGSERLPPRAPLRPVTLPSRRRQKVGGWKVSKLEEHWKVSKVSKVIKEHWLPRGATER